MEAEEEIKFESVKRRWQYGRDVKREYKENKVAEKGMEPKIVVFFLALKVWAGLKKASGGGGCYSIPVPEQERWDSADRQQG